MMLIVCDMTVGDNRQYGGFTTENESGTDETLQPRRVYLASQKQLSLHRSWSAGEILQPRRFTKQVVSNKYASSMERW